MIPGMGATIGGFEQAAGGGVGAHRHWRVYYATVFAGNTRCAAAEIELRESIGGADATGSGTASASNAGAGAASNAFDNNNATSWTTSSSQVPGWIAYDFGSGVTKDIRQVALTADASVPGRSPQTGAIEYSDDGSSWSNALTLPTQSAWSANEQRLFNI